MHSIGIVPEANTRQKGLRKPLSERLQKSSRHPSGGRFAIVGTANTS